VSGSVCSWGLEPCAPGQQRAGERLLEIEARQHKALCNLCPEEGRQQTLPGRPLCCPATPLHHSAASTLQQGQPGSFEGSVQPDSLSLSPAGMGTCREGSGPPLSILGRLRYPSGNGCERERVPDGMGSRLALCEQDIAASWRLASRIIGIMLAVCH
jgi:hypothetical protein